MSFITTVEATPSRVLGTFRYLVANGPVPLDVLAARHWPKSTQSEKGKFPTALRLEMVGSGLVVESEGGLEPSPDLPDDVRSSPDMAEARLPFVIADLAMFGAERVRDLAYATAWLLGFDPRDSPGNDTEMVARATEGAVKDLVKVTSDPTYHMLKDWAGYLGLGWEMPGPVNAVRGQGRFVPDPTAFLRVRLADLLPEQGTPVPIRVFRKQLAKKAPIFEGGAIRSEIEEITGSTTEDGTLAASTALALHRIADEGLIELSAPSDASVQSLPLFGQARVAYVTRLSKQRKQPT